MTHKVDALRKKLLSLTGEAGVSNFDTICDDRLKGHTPKFLMALGKKHHTYSQDLIEFGLQLVGDGLTAPQAESVIRTFVEFEYPTFKEGRDYRIPDAKRFSEWRLFLGPLGHYVSLSVIKVSQRWHGAHDATTKRNIHIFQTQARCEVEQPDGSILVGSVPLKFDITLIVRTSSSSRMHTRVLTPLNQVLQFLIIIRRGPALQLGLLLE